jgi:peroxiredoxin
MSKTAHHPKAAAAKGPSTTAATKRTPSSRRPVPSNARKLPSRPRRTRRSAAMYWIAGLAAATVLIVGISLAGGGSAQGPAGVNIRTLPVGSVAPTFSAYDALSGQPIDGSTLAGKNVLYFFNSGSTCQACMVEAEDLQKNSAMFQRAHIALVMVTNDSTASLVAAARADGLSLPMVADPKGVLTTRFGAVGGGMNMGANTADHSFILVNRFGVVRFHRDFPNMWITAPALLKLLPKLT